MTAPAAMVGTFDGMEVIGPVAGGSLLAKQGAQPAKEGDLTSPRTGSQPWLTAPMRR